MTILEIVGYVLVGVILLFITLVLISDY